MQSNIITSLVPVEDTKLTTSGKNIKNDIFSSMLEQSCNCLATTDPSLTTNTNNQEGQQILLQLGNGLPQLMLKELPVDANFLNLPAELTEQSLTALAQSISQELAAKGIDKSLVKSLTVTADGKLQLSYEQQGEEISAQLDVDALAVLSNVAAAMPKLSQLDNNKLLTNSKPLANAQLLEGGHSHRLLIGNDNNRSKLEHISSIIASGQQQHHDEAKVSVLSKVPEHPDIATKVFVDSLVKDRITGLPIDDSAVKFDNLLRHQVVQELSATDSARFLHSSQPSTNVNTYAAHSALAQPMSSDLLIPAQIGSKAWGNHMGERMVWLVHNNIQSASMQLNPPELGPMEVRIAMDHDKASIVFTSGHSAVRDAIEQALPRLREMMQDTGLQLANVNVSEHSLRGQGQMAQQFARDSSAGNHNQADGATSDNLVAEPVIDSLEPQQGVIHSSVGLLDIYA